VRSAGGFAGDWSVLERGLYVGEDACFATAWVRAGASAPAIRARRVWPCYQIRVSGSFSGKGHQSDC